MSNNQLVETKRILQERNNPLYHDCLRSLKQGKSYSFKLHGREPMLDKTFVVFHNSTRQLTFYHDNSIVGAVWITLNTLNSQYLKWGIFTFLRGKEWYFSLLRGKMIDLGTRYGGNLHCNKQKFPGSNGNGAVLYNWPQFRDNFLK